MFFSQGEKHAKKAGKKFASKNLVALKKRLSTHGLIKNLAPNYDPPYKRGLQIPLNAILRKNFPPWGSQKKCALVTPGLYQPNLGYPLNGKKRLTTINRPLEHQLPSLLLPFPKPTD